MNFKIIDAFIVLLTSRQILTSLEKKPHTNVIFFPLLLARNNNMVKNIYVVVEIERKNVRPKHNIFYIRAK